MAVPKLRFPGFESDETWELSNFNNVYDLKITNSLSRAKLNYDEGDIKNIHYGDIHTKFSSTFNVEKEEVPYINEEKTSFKCEVDDFCIEGDIVLADASEDIKDIGKAIEITNISHEKVVCGLHTIHARPKQNKLYVGFGAYLFQSSFIRKQIQLESQGAKVLGLSKGRLEKISLLIPKKQEQQKIADCLSSLDALIKAESEHLDALKSHKTGLLQKLFPADGETVPKFRFGEFKDDEDWEVSSLSKVCEMKAGDFVQASEIHDVSQNDLYPCYGGNGLRGFTDSYTHDGVFPLIGRQGALCGNINLIKGQFHATEHALVCTPKPNIDVIWLYYQLVLLDLNKYATGQAQPGLSVKNLNDIPCKVPLLLEQRKIADCLSSLDNLIQFKADKIKALRYHKQGLMQQLFPEGGI